MFPKNRSLVSLRHQKLMVPSVLYASTVILEKESLGSRSGKKMVLGYEKVLGTGLGKES